MRRRRAWLDPRGGQRSDLPRGDRGLAQIVRTGWYTEVRIKSHGAYVIRALLTARDALVSIRVRLENEIRGLLKTFGVMFGQRVGGFMRRDEEIMAEDLAMAPELRPNFEALVAARRGGRSSNVAARSTASCVPRAGKAASFAWS